MSSHRSRVLIVDDDATVRDVIALAVASGGRDPVRVATVPDALAELEREPVDLVVTDLNLPGSGGLELLAELSARRNAPPAVVVTATGDDGAKRAARLLGARAVVDKPFALLELRRTIDGVAAPVSLLDAA
jgi:CheY-like chemotaxis protein